MMLNLTEIYKSVLSENAFVDYNEYKLTRQFTRTNQKATDLITANVASIESLNKIYELEYKLFMLAEFKRSKGDYLEDPDNIKFLNLSQSWIKNLEELTKDMLEKMYNIFSAWITLEETTFMIKPGIEEDEFFREVEKRYVNLYGERSGASFAGGYRPPKDPSNERSFLELDVELRQKMAKDRLAKEPFKSVNWLINNLKSKIHSKDLKQLVVTFHMALNTAHNNGSMAMILFGGPGTTKFTERGTQVVNHLDDLSNGKYISKWNEELNKLRIFPSVQSSGATTSEAINDNTQTHPSPQDVISAINFLK